MSYDFADRLIEMRRSRGLSQEELAKELGLSRQAISKWERAESAPDIGNLVALSNIYEVTLDELVRGAASAEAEAAPEEEAPALADEASTTEAPAPAAAAAAVPASAPAAPQAVTPPPPPDNAVPAQPAGAPVIPPPPPQAAESPKPRNPFYTFPYPLLVALVYLILGFCFGLWHPGWVIFFTIPFYYWIASVIVHDPEYAAHHGGRAE